jgi:FKBP-type peptidyl-prolyl cis-trans isomerase SlyD
MQIATHTIVAIRYSMQNSKGEVLENILEGSPVEYLHGSGHLLPELEDDLVGLRAGDKKQVFVSSKSYTEVDDDFSFDIIVDSVRLATEEEIKMGRPMESVEEECGPECIC